MTALNHSLTDSPAPAAAVLSFFRGNLPNPNAPTLRAFANTPATKEQVLTNLRAHQRADRFINQHYWDTQRRTGSAVGCTIHDFAPGRENDHLAYEELFGIPIQVAVVQDIIFGYLQGTAQTKWPLRFMEAVPQGANLSQVLIHWAASILDDPRSPLAPHQDHPGISQVAALYRQWADTGAINPTMAAIAADRTESALDDDEPPMPLALSHALTGAWGALEYAGTVTGIPTLPTLPLSKYQEDLAGGLGFLPIKAAEVHACHHENIPNPRELAWEIMADLFLEAVARSPA